MSYSFYTRPLEFLCRDRDTVCAFVASSSTFFNSSIIPSILTDQDLWKSLSNLLWKETNEHNKNNNEEIRRALLPKKYFKTKKQMKADKRDDPDYCSDNDTDSSDDDEDNNDPTLHYAAPMFIKKRDPLKRLFSVFKHSATLQFTHKLDLESEFCGNDPQSFIEFEVLTPLLLFEFAEEESTSNNNNNNSPKKTSSIAPRLVITKPPSHYFHRTLKHFQCDYLSSGTLNLILEKIVSLESFDLRYSQTCLSDRKFLEKGLTKPPFACSASLTYLNLQSMRIDIDEVFASRFIRHFPNLRHLLLGGNYGVSRRGLEQLKDMRNLRELDLSQMTIHGGFTLKPDVNASNRNQNNATAHTFSNDDDYDYTNIESTTHALSVLSPKFHLKNSINAAADEGDQHSSSSSSIFFWPSASLTSLNLSFCQGVSDNALQLLTLLGNSSGKDNTNDSSSSSSTPLPPPPTSLTLFDTLEKLELSNVFQATSDCLKYISRLQNLTYLDLQQLENCSGDVDEPWSSTAEDVSEALLNLVNLRHLDLSVCSQVTDVTMNFLATNAEYYEKTMEHLDLSETSISGITMQKIAAFKNLKFLSIRGVASTSRFSSGDISCLKGLRKLEHLCLDVKNYVNPSGMMRRCLGDEAFLVDKEDPNTDDMGSKSIKKKLSSSADKKENNRKADHNYCWLSKLDHLKELHLFSFQISDELVADFAQNHACPWNLKTISIVGDQINLTDITPLTRFSSLKKLRIESCLAVNVEKTVKILSNRSFTCLEKVNFTGSFSGDKTKQAIVTAAIPKTVEILYGVGCE